MSSQKFLELPDIEGIELRYTNIDRLMLDERETLLKDIDAASIKLFGIVQIDTLFDFLPDGIFHGNKAEWDSHFEFLYWEFEEEGDFWTAVGIDVNGPDGEQLECLVVFGRQLVCAIKGLHSAASLKFMTGVPRSDQQLAAEAEAWGKALTRNRS